MGSKHVEVDVNAKPQAGYDDQLRALVHGFEGSVISGQLRVSDVFID